MAMKERKDLGANDYTCKFCLPDSSTRYLGSPINSFNNGAELSLLTGWSPNMILCGHCVTICLKAARAAKNEINVIRGPGIYLIEDNLDGELDLEN